MKKILSMLLLLLSVMTLVSCKPRLTNDPVDISKYRTEQTAYINMSKEYIVSDSLVNIHFLEESYIPYIDIIDYIKMLDGVYHSKDFEYTKIYEKELLTISYSISYDDGDDYIYTLELNAKSDMISVLDLNFFDGYMITTETNYSEGLVSLEPVVEDGNNVIFDLAAYDFDLVVHNELFLMPLAITNLLFNQANYFDLYYNGETIYGIDTSDVDDVTLKEIMSSQYNNIAMPDEIKLYNYNYYCFIIDYFYGLKGEREITSGNDFIKKSEFMIGDVSKNIFDVVTKLDDLHSYHIARGYYENPKLEINYTTKKQGSNISNFYKGMDDVYAQGNGYFKKYYGIVNGKNYEYINNDETLVIYLQGFEVETPKEVETIIKAANPATRNVILDLTFNTGGNLGAVLRILALTTNKEIWYHFINPLSNEKISYGVTGDRPAYDQYTYFVKTSSITFSAANLTASIAKELGIKVIGQKSSGGASAIGFFVFPDGSIINMSSNDVLTNNKYESIEKGITPDIVLKNLYNQTEIGNAINAK